MIKSYGIPGESQETRTELEQPAPYVLMSNDRPGPHYICQVIDGVGMWVEVAERHTVCTPAQGLVALFVVKNITESDILTAIDNISNPVDRYTCQIGYTRATEWERGSGSFQRIAELLGLTEDDLDALFDIAVTVKV